ncbi:exonuclease domain-containing protein [Cellulomonas cellasea]|uniref:exonuclease domain-containing protein n=1 Tax=Cellulomonas cellasea TaxID=43670 RepID=UPI0025A47562|nr:exonuclease domain-containing protein [Cellulomonas cellasea]MDM8084884.1 exonuclease domain-containing protein [Cellulomonas cellasea]
MSGYAVVDVETTGLFPGGHDRIVEIAVVQVSPGGEVEESWATLVNPQRDLGPQHIHGIRASDVLTAPTFAQIAGTLSALLVGRVFVAHNASFDRRFVQHEFGALGHDVPLVAETTLCTMEWSSRLLPHAPRSLAGCCATAGITLTDAHEALADATATAALLRHYLHKAGMPSGARGRSLLGSSMMWQPPWAGTVELAKTALWPRIPATDIACVRRGSAAERQTPFLARLVDHLPRTAETWECEQYLALVDRALLDRVVSVREQEGLARASVELGIDRPTALQLHRAYLDSLARTAWADGVVTDDEVEDLCAVATLLSLSADDVDRALSSASAGPVVPGTDAEYIAPAQFRLRVGDLVVFTGDMVEPRDTWVGRASRAGVVAHPSVTKKVTLVVAADPDSLSGKARKAADYGIPIVTEHAFSGLLEDLVARSPAL